EKLALRIFADERKTVVRFDYLARPAMIDLSIRQQFLQRIFQATETGLGICDLSGLMIFAAEDRIIEIRVPIDAQIIVRIVRVPERCDRHAAPRQFRADRVARVQRELGLKKRGADHARLAYEWIVR